MLFQLDLEPGLHDRADHLGEQAVLARERHTLRASPSNELLREIADPQALRRRHHRARSRVTSSTCRHGHDPPRPAAPSRGPSDHTVYTHEPTVPFVKNLPAAAETPTITNLADGALEFSAKVPAASIPGSYATYTKVVGPDGVTTSFIKTTIAPDGSVVSAKVKYP